MQAGSPERYASNMVQAGRLARLLADRLGAPAVAIGGSTATGAFDNGSDIDLYVYCDPIPANKDRAAVAQAFGAEAGAEIGNAFFEPCDEWRHADSATDVDITYRAPGWIEDKLDAVLVRHEASLGYTTCLWHNVLTAKPLVDTEGWFAELQRRASAEYPDALARSIVDRNWAMLAQNKNSWLVQLKAALQRGDVVSAGHRTSAFLASYFDVLFAINRQPHPGEKRLLAWAASLCEVRPIGLDQDVLSLLDAAGRGEAATGDHAESLLEKMELFAMMILKGDQ